MAIEIVDFPIKNGGLVQQLGLMNGGYPLVNVYIAIENGPVEIVDFPSYKMVDLSIAKC